MQSRIRLLLLFASFLATSLAAAPPEGQNPPAHVIYSDRHDSSAPLHTIRPNPPRAGEILELPRKWLPNRPGVTPPGETDTVVQSAPGTEAAPTTTVTFEGVNNVSGVLPPDTVGDIGPNHYVQAVNLAFAIYNKSGTLLYGPANINTLFSGFGGPCQTRNDGDPIVLYDHLADRWLISQFALPNFPFGPFYQCIAISQTPDPTGAWYRYGFQISSNKMNDYPKFAVWPDGYYMSMNQFNQASLSWGGAGAVVFERDKMLLGQSARAVYFDLYSTDPNLGGMLPSDLDGPAPPTGTPNYFAQIDDNAWGYPADQLEIWKFQTNWTQPASSTFTLARILPTASFDGNMCNGSRNCIPQPGGTKVDAIADRLLFRLQYRNFGTHQAMVTNHTVDVNGADLAGIRWYELRDTGAGWNIYQQGTYSPDSTHRWMGSIAMDSSGNVALGYSASSTSVYPSIRYTGRLASDQLGQMTLGEGTIVAGSGYQTHSSGRWGDYSAMSVNESDCSFWYTQEYYNGVSSASWRTRVGSFQISPCGSPPPPPPPATPVHSGDLDGASSPLPRNKWQARITVTVHNGSHGTVSGATVSGTWSGGFSGAATCTTDGNGQCSVTTGGIPAKKTSATFTVNNITGTNLTYQASANHDPETDSDGTAITVAKPL
ncbi:MAG TPA: Ig-like domain-containing protein [Bryobacteraceae bacterium]|nr:Ig-like domain-containing protein [Bryobacteraceae bacterium]